MKRFDTTLYAVSLTAGMAMIGLNLLSAYETVEYKPESVRRAEQADNAIPSKPIDIAQPINLSPLPSVEDVAKRNKVLAQEKTTPPGKVIAVDSVSPSGGNFQAVGNGDVWTKK
ncbi:hypothetical protein HNQ59_001490 [Chitinivorax tropicus]|uniref:Uncharacterized protein n=1 Tax=Chitinivorax tropicus TaxID=714531 RepID=A0A840ML30_9PROT|nr:hypothetical protein [Chitinivorax tropicus]MBB5018205.1 hypothetical protein [Chitinivorax tropicus]